MNCKSFDGDVKCEEQATLLIFWPEKPTEACEKHAQKIWAAITAIMGFAVNSYPIVDESSIGGTLTFEPATLDWETDFHGLDYGQAEKDGYINCTNDLCRRNRDRIRTAVTEERERCARVADKILEALQMMGPIESESEPRNIRGLVAAEIARKIRDGR